MPNTIDQVCQFLEKFAPLQLAADWDNVGLLVGDRKAITTKVMTCLTVTPEVVREAIDKQVSLIVTHHPMPFKPVGRITRDSIVGGMLLDLLANSIAVFSPHTAFDSCGRGINQRIATGIGLTKIRPFEENEKDPTIGVGRLGDCESPVDLAIILKRVSEFFQVAKLQYSSGLQKPVKRVGIACGSAGSMLGQAGRLGCQVFITGEANFHTALEARALGMAILLVGHFETERFGVVALVDEMRTEFPQLDIFPSSEDTNPLLWS